MQDNNKSNLKVNQERSDIIHLEAAIARLEEKLSGHAEQINKIWIALDELRSQGSQILIQLAKQTPQHNGKGQLIERLVWAIVSLTAIVGWIITGKTP